jgi:hypothetical protein
MTAAAVLVLSVNALLGAWLGWQFLLGVRNRPRLVDLHFLLGLAGLLLLAWLLLAAGTPLATQPRWLLGLVAGAMLTGTTASLLARRYRGAITPAVTAHATIATLAFGLLLAWAIA